MSETFDTTAQIVIIMSLVFLTGVIVLIFVAVKNSLEDSRKISQRLKNRVKSSDKSILKRSKVVENFTDHLSLPEQDEITKIRFRLSQAGFYSTSSVKIYYAVRLLCLIVPQFFVFLFWGYLNAKIGIGMTAVVAVIVTLIGLYAPPYFISFRKKMRTDQIRSGFPDMMDLMVACIEAGLSLSAALMRVADEIGGRYPALKINLDLLILELRAGRERHKGMTNFAERTDLEEARALAVMIRQAEEMGSSLGKALRTFSTDMRYKRMMKAEEKAMALSAKLTVPLILFIFPSIMAMLLLPAGVRLMETF